MSRLPDSFKAWQKRFYKSKQWQTLRDEIRENKKMRCDICGRLIRGKSIVDHITEITPETTTDEDITLNPDNLQLLCLACHNQKTFGAPTPQDFELQNRNEINFF